MSIASILGKIAYDVNKLLPEDLHSEEGSPEYLAARNQAIQMMRLAKGFDITLPFTYLMSLGGAGLWGYRRYKGDPPDSVLSRLGKALVIGGIASRIMGGRYADKVREDAYQLIELARALKAQDAAMREMNNLGRISQQEGDRQRTAKKAPQDLGPIAPQKQGSAHRKSGTDWGRVIALAKRLKKTARHL
jgi:hypothetical protein